MLIITCAGVWGAHGPLLSWPSQFLDGPAASTGFAIIKTIGALGSFSGSYLVGMRCWGLWVVLYWVVVYWVIVYFFDLSFQVGGNVCVCVCVCGV